MVKLVTYHPEVAHVVCKDKHHDTLEAIIDLPLISLKVTGGSRIDLEYFARFGSGTLHYDYDPPSVRYLFLMSAY